MTKSHGQPNICRGALFFPRAHKTRKFFQKTAFIGKLAEQLQAEIAMPPLGRVVIKNYAGFRVHLATLFYPFTRTTFAILYSFHNICFCPLLLASHYFQSTLFSFQGAGYFPVFFKTRLKHLIAQVLQPKLEAAFSVGGGNRARTDDPLLAKQVLFQLSYTPMKVLWWAQVDSNHRPHDYQSCALAS